MSYVNVYTVLPSIAGLHAGAAYLMRSPVGVKGALVLSLSTSVVYIILTRASNRFLEGNPEHETIRLADGKTITKEAEKTNPAARFVFDILLVATIFVVSCKLSEIVGYPIDYKTAGKLHAGAAGIATAVVAFAGTVGLLIILVVEYRKQRQHHKDMEENEKMTQDALKKLNKTALA